MREFDGTPNFASLNERLAFWEQFPPVHCDRDRAQLRFDYLWVFHNHNRVHILCLVEVERLTDGLRLEDAMSGSCRGGCKLGVAPICRVTTVGQGYIVHVDSPRRRSGFAL